MNTYPLRLSACLFLCVSLNSFALPVASTFSGLGSYNIPEDISSDGAVVVGFNHLGITSSFKYENGNFSSIGINGRAYGVSGDGSTIVGLANNPNNSAFILKNGATTFYKNNFPEYGLVSTNYDGSVSVGYRWHPNYHRLESVKISNSTEQGLPHLNGGYFRTSIVDISDDASILVGQSDSTLGSEPFAIIDGAPISLGDLPGGRIYGQSEAISGNGNYIVGASEIEFEGEIASEAFIYKDNQMFGLNDFNGGLFESRANGVSNSGVVVGYGRITDGIRASLWEDDSFEPQSIKEILLTSGIDIESQGWILTKANGISSDGSTIIGQGIHNGINEGWIVTLTPVPLPAGIYLFLSGLVGLVGFKLRGRNA